MRDKRMVMTIGTTEVAIRQKEDRTNPAWPVQKRGFEKSLDIDHGKIGIKFEARNPGVASRQRSIRNNLK
jgi:hypothetical protein